jgi:demethylmenaquinone methyltransferase / 2-methoxy-6-polyprenyl-1,4-benzoquinol methylase
MNRPEPVPPHPLMPALYRDNAEKHEWLRRIFDETAGDYDRVESWLSLGSGRWYRRRALGRGGLGPGMRVADVACGTGLVAREAGAIVGSGGRVVGIDPSPGMLEHAQRNLGIPTVVGVAESLPFPGDQFDFVSMGYALPHVTDQGAAFAEFARVLRPGGRVCILEITRPAGRIGRALLRGYMSLLSGALRVMRPTGSRTAELWSYYWQTIDRCVPPARVLGALGAAGFDEVRHHAELGLFSEYTARRPDASESGAGPGGRMPG